MKLEKIYFDAYKSLLKKELIVTNGCIGFVGINESGKSNLLEAISILGNNRNLRISDTPRMAKDNFPKVRYEFKLSQEECSFIINEIVSELDKHSVTKKIFNNKEFTLIYNVEFDKKLNLENRYFTLNGINLNENVLILRKGKGISEYKVQVADVFVPLNELTVIKKELFEKHDAYINNCKKLDEIESAIIANELDLNEIQGNISHEPINQAAIDSENKEAKTDTPAVMKKRKELQKLKDLKSEIENKVGDYNLLSIKSNNKKLLNEAIDKIEKIEKEIEKVNIQIKELVAIATKDAQQNSFLNQHQTTLKNSMTELEKLIKNKQNLERVIEHQEEPIDKKYTDNINELKSYFSSKLNQKLTSWLPKVVYWEHSDSYILESNTPFKDIIDKKSLDELSRPLVNVFRICLGIQTIDDLKNKILEIQQDESERSRLNDTFNRKFDEFLKEVWSDYDQKIKISLEEHQIRIQFFDPECLSASYYSMQERSQGCQTFISFLLTIGAEAKKNVIKETVLLLDEPETHLHPSGVRYMLKELIKIAENGNNVIFATHSIFMIDRSNFGRHIILTKNKEHTEIQPSTHERIGFFLQEEVLYGALNINLSEDFKSSNQFNFVFEGEGDAIIFRYFYEKQLNSKERPFQDKNTSFYHGGGCKGITKYFNTAPIQLGTKWVVILDKDTPADSLKNMIEGRYKDYLNRDVFVFQYERNDLKVLELEDVLPLTMIIESYLETIDHFCLSIDKSDIEKLVTDKEPFIIYNDSVINKCNPECKDKFKAKFKENLNKRVEKELERIKDKDSFSQIFSSYDSWAREVIGKINEGIKKANK